MGWKRYAIGTAFLLTFAGAAAAADYPFSGLFNYPPDGVSDADAPLYCAYNFFDQRPDGSFANYHLDLAQYRKDGAIRYLVFSRGACSVDDKNVESCSMSWDANPKNIGQTFFDVIQSTRSEEVIIAFADTKADATNYVDSGKPEPTGVGRYFRCGFDAATIAKYRTDIESTLRDEERDAIIAPDPGDETRSAMRAILKTITGK